MLAMMYRKNTSELPMRDCLKLVSFFRLLNTNSRSGLGMLAAANKLELVKKLTL